MKIAFFSVTLVALLLVCSVLPAQDLSNKGRDFWIAYTGHIDGTQSVMGLYLTSDIDAAGTVWAGANSISYTVKANKVTTIFIGPGNAGNLPNTLVYNGQADGINVNGGIHVTSDRNIVVYAHIIRTARSGATLVLPATVLGTEYIVPSYHNNGAQGAKGGYGEITVVAVKPQTTIEIIPAVIDRSGKHPADTAFRVVLNNPGDVYQLQSKQNADFSGSKVRSIQTDPAQGCKPIAVYSSTTWSGFDCTGSTGGDNLFQQLFPLKSWGKKFVTAPFVNKDYDIVRVFVQDTSTIVKKTENGITTILGGRSPAGYYEIKTPNPLVIEASKPVSVVQYITSQSCGGGDSDPEMILINPVEQTLNNITLFSAHKNFVPTDQTQVHSHYINVVIPTSFKQSFRIDNNPPAGSFVDIPGTGYSYLREDVTVSSGINPVHNLRADTGFTAIVYGYGLVESYGYNAGANVRDLYQYVSVKNQYATVDFPAACRNSPFYFFMTFPYEPSQIKWQFKGLFADTILNAPVYDTTWMEDGKPLYRYRLPSPYTVKNTGTFPVTVSAQNPSPDGCNGLQEIDFELQVFEAPTAFYNFSSTGCMSDSLAFTDNPANGNGRKVVQYLWDFGDGNTAASADIKHKFLAPGSYPVAHAIITDAGCISDTVRKTVSLSTPPLAKFGIETPNCVGKAIRFNDSSSVQAGVNIAKWTWDFGDGSATRVVNSNAQQTYIYRQPGTYTVSLIVETAGGCRSELFSKPVTIYVNPQASFKVPVICMPVGAAAFTNESVISDGTQGSMAYQWDFGDGSAPSPEVSPLHQFPSQGPFTVSLLVTSVNGCTDDSLVSLNNIFAQPRAMFTIAKKDVCLGERFEFSDQSQAANSSVSGWTWDFGDGSPIPTSQPDQSWIYSTPGTYQVKLSVVSAAGCPSDTAVQTVVVHSLPNADFNVSQPVCVGQDISLIDASSSVSGNIVKWYWDFGDGTNTVLSSNEIFTHQYRDTGGYQIQLRTETDKGCTGTTSSMNLVINPLPIPAFGMPENCLNDPYSQFRDSSAMPDGSLGAFRYLWDFGDPLAGGTNPNTVTARNPRHKYAQAGTYPVRLTVTSPQGCAATLIQTFQVNGGAPQAAFTVADPAICGNEDLVVQNNSTVDVGQVIKLEIFWDYNGNPTNKTIDEDPVPGRQYAHRYPEFGGNVNKTYRVRMIAYSGINCLHAYEQAIIVKPTPLLAQAAMAPGICEDLPSFMPEWGREFSGMNGSGLYSGDGIDINGLFSPLQAKAGDHLVRYTFKGDNGCTNFTENTISVLASPFASAGPDKFLLEGGQVVLNGSANGDNLTYQWSPGMFLNDPGIATPIATPTEDITYTLTVISQDGCRARDEVFVKVLKTPLIPNVFTPNGDGHNDKWEIRYLDSYPGNIVEIFNRYGQLVFRSVGYGIPWDGTYQGKELPAGTYYYVIDPKNGRKKMAGFVDIVR